MTPNRLLKDARKMNELKGRTRPRYKCEIGKAKDGWELSVYRDQLGNVTFHLWKLGKGFRDDVKVSPRDLRKLRGWLDQIIKFQERP